MSANTETTVADRTKCAEWCGKEYGARGVPFRRSCGFPMYFEHGAAFNVAVKDNEPAWCSIACRDARLPPVAAPAAPKIEVKATVGGMCPLCGVAVPSTHIHVCGAAPAAHIERRKGQRWRSGHTPPIEFTLAEPLDNTRIGNEYMETWRDTGGRSWYFGHVELRNLTLLADATPEPAKPMRLCEHCCAATEVSGPDVDAVMCSTCVGAGYSLRPKKSPSAQEAPKAAPVLEWSFTDDENRVHRFATGNERDDASRAYWSWTAEQTGEPYAGPERLPRPQLAADWVEDCLEDA